MQLKRKGLEMRKQSITPKVNELSDISRAPTLILNSNQTYANSFTLIKEHVSSLEFYYYIHYKACDGTHENLFARGMKWENITVKLEEFYSLMFVCIHFIK